MIKIYNLIMDSTKNPLSNIPDINTRHMIMQVLAWMWSAVFGIYIVESIYAFGISAFAHAALITMTVLTAIYFKQVRKERITGIHTRGKGGEHE